MKYLIVSFLVISLFAYKASAQSYLPLTGGTLNGNLGIGTNSSNGNLFLYKKIGTSGTNDYGNVAQHYLPFQIYNTTNGVYNNRKLEIGVLDNGTAVLQANAAGEGYFPIHLNPVAGGVLIGNGNTMNTSYTLQVGGTSYFNNIASFGSNINVNGNFGLGTNSPSQHFTAYQNDANPNIILAKQDGSGSFSYSSVNVEASGGVGGAITAWGNNSIRQGAVFIETYSNNPLAFGTNDEERMRITSYGNVGIGTTNPTEKLSVNGNIKSKKLIVTQTGWADYVFKPTYKLKPLTEVEQYIKIHQHLPEVPSAKEVKENGVDIGDTQTILLKKVEELTLYMIQQEKKIAALQEQSELQQVQINQLRKDKNK